MNDWRTDMALSIGWTILLILSITMTNSKMLPAFCALVLGGYLHKLVSE